MLTHDTQVEQRATFDDRFYEITKPGGSQVFYPSVTNILSDVNVGHGLDQWKQEQAEALGVDGARLSLALRAQYGLNVHAAVEKYNKGGVLEWIDPATDQKNFTDFEWKCICRYVQWLEDYEVEILATEMTVFSHKHRYAGTCDIICNVGGVTHVVDVKTSKQATDVHMLQVASYRLAVAEMFPELPVKGIGVIALSSRNKIGYQWKDGGDTLKVFGYDCRFLKRCELFHMEHPNFEPKRDILPVTLTPTHNQVEIKS